MTGDHSICVSAIVVLAGIVFAMFLLLWRSWRETDNALAAGKFVERGAKR